MSATTTKKRKPKKEGILLKLPTNPWVTITLILIALVSLILMLIFYFSSQQERELVYAVNPIRTMVVASGKASELKVLYEGTDLGDVDITATQVAIWNIGKESIRKENILEGIVIYTVPPVRILEVTIRERSRDATIFALNATPESRENGLVPVSWKILEQNDGASVQLIYVGSEEVDISMQGTIEGLHDIRCVDLGVAITDPAEQISKYQRGRWIWGIMAVVMGCATIFFFIVAFMKPRRWQDFLFAGSSLPLFTISILQWLSIARAPWPPFGF